MKLIREIKKAYAGMYELEQKLFWVIAPIITIVSFVSMIATIIENLGFVQSCMAVASFSISLFLIITGWKTKKYEACYFAYCIFLNCLFIPVTFITNGGIHSGMTLFCLGAILLCAFCSQRIARIISLLAGLLVYFAVFVASDLHPEIVTAISEDFIPTDIMLSFLLVSLSMFVICSTFIKEVKKYALNQRVLDRYMDANIKKLLLENESIDQLIDRPGNKCRVTILFVDVCNFTATAERLKPEQIAEFLNTFLSIADQCIHDNGGTLDKYIGDCTMAFWVDSDGTGYGAREACQTVLDIKRKLGEQVSDIYEKYGCELDVSSGINYGEAIVGGIGSKYRKDYTVIGDAVNIASRLESIAPTGFCYVSKSVAEILRGSIELDQVQEKVFLKGKTKPIQVYSLKGLDKTEAVPVHVRAEEKIGFSLTVCGCRGSNSVSGLRFAEFGGETSCYILKKDRHAIVIDCGTGLYTARPLLKDCDTIDVLLTHVHYDHILGFLDFSVFPKNAELTFYGNFSEWFGTSTIHELLRHPFWPVDMSYGKFVGAELGKEYHLGDDVRVVFHPATHPDNARLLTIDVADCKICMMGDCEDPNDLPLDLITRCDLLFYDGMYNRKEKWLHEGWGHSTWEDGVELGKKAQVFNLIITHHDPHNSDTVLREMEAKAKQIYPNARFARAGDVFLI